MLKIKGKNELSGEVDISGSKNAALPIIGACLLIRGKVVLNNMPKIRDVNTFLDIVSEIGIVYSWRGNTLIINSSNINKNKLDYKKIKKVRASIFLLSPILHIFGDINIPFPGGCVIGRRPIDLHLKGLEIIGYKYKYIGENIHISGESKSGNKIINCAFSVSCTENLIIANTLRIGRTVLKNTAIEPHVINLIDFFRKAGAFIELKPNHEIVIEGVKELKKNFDFDVISDYIQSGTFMVIGALISKEYLDIKNARVDDLYVFIEKLKEAGVKLKYLGNDIIRVYRCKNIKNIDIQTNIFPGFPTDLQSPFSILQTQAKGMNKIHEVLFEGRLNFLVELEKMGVNLALVNPHEAIIFGPNELKATTVNSWDLRAGMAMVIAGLIADGETRVTNVEYIYRGYENFVEKLNSLGACIKDED